ncbi:molybdopterin-dependent oxidoreductase [Variovorax guangxiensis]|uniref:molybdopterin-dependent oxidoreductase n=1 Tax=Variovorax guangxiensis TaxID=1775474 RepID=UPI00285D9C79|nr:molybdopterin-dependent oxidoreductase [Variovorax guangxiensis]MDR6860951.1 hypothetical protein [Variovorax guangxiensis]
MAASLMFVLALGAPMIASAQCVRDAFLAVSSPAPTGGLRNAVELTEAQLLALPTSIITTSTEWTPVSRFEGPLLSDVLKLAAVQGRALRVFAMDDYSISIPWSDLAQYGVILAHTRDGERMTRRRFGPLFVIYPRDKFAALQTPTMGARFVWQVCRIDVE